MLKNISNDKIEVPNFLHFDASKGCTAEVLIAALLDLCSHRALSSIESAYKALNLSSPTPVLSNLSPYPSKNLYENREKTYRTPLWNEPAEIGEERRTHLEENQPASQKICFTHLQKHISDSSLHPIITSIVTKALNELTQAYARVGVDHVDEDYAQTLVGTCVTFATLIHLLNPLGVTANKVPISTPLKNTSALEKKVLSEQPVLFTLLENIPSFETAWPGAFSDILGVALLKSVVSSFGLRPEGVLLKTSTGFSRALISHSPLSCFVHQVEPKQIPTRAIESSLHTSTIQSLHKVDAIVGQAFSVPAFLSKLSQMGAQEITTEHIFADGMNPRTKISLFCSTSSLNTLAELLLTQGEAAYVSSHPIEHHTLRQRVVSVAFGRGQSVQYCKVVEYLSGDKVVRAEPVEEDLATLVATTGFSREALRKDILERI